MAGIAQLLSDLPEWLPDREAVASEIEVLESIYGSDSIRNWQPEGGATRDGTLKYEVTASLPSPHDGIPIKILVSLSKTYPVSSPPQLQLLSRYIGSYGADAALFGAVLKTYMSVNGVEWSPDVVCVFDGVQHVLDLCLQWYEEHLTAHVAENSLREHLKDDNDTSTSETAAQPNSPAPAVGLPSGIRIFEAEPILDRKSAFVGRACAITDPAEVPIILSHLTSDRRIARAAHPIINAWRCQAGAVLHQDNDDDGETAAGGRLAHLLQILEVKNVLVVVTRYFGGIHLGPDRFKHINQAARNALEIGGFLDSIESKKPSRGRKH